MPPLLISLAVLLLIGGIFFALERRRRLRREWLFAQPLSPEDVDALNEHVPLFRLLPDDLRTELSGHVNVFLDEKNFHGCQGLEVTHEMRLIIAAQACVLLLNKNIGYFPSLKSIHIYPSTFFTELEPTDDDLLSHRTTGTLGLSWYRGPVVLSWDAVLKGAYHPEDGSNVVIHEFAHQLDQEDSVMDGTPLLESKSQIESWTRVLSDEYARLHLAIEGGDETLIHHYGATSPVEFYAVVTEVFFEQPKAMKRDHPRLYQELKKYYRLDPALWFERSRASKKR